METALPTTLIDLAARIPDEDAAYRLLEILRWGRDTQVCPHCATVGGHYFIKPRTGTRQTRTGAVTQRRLWKCKACRRQFSVLVGTVMHRSKIPVRKWLFVLFEMCASKNGVAAREVERKYGLTPKAAWFMMHRIREAMKDDSTDLFDGIVEADETWVGGRKRMAEKLSNKTPVVTVIERETGRARSRVVERVTTRSVWRVLVTHVDRDARLMTDESSVYRPTSRYWASHETVNHGAREYVRGDVTTNTAEGFFSQLKRSLDGTHHYVSGEHLGRYVAEFDFRYNSRNLGTTEQVRKLTQQAAGRRLTYRESSSEPSASVLVAA